MNVDQLKQHKSWMLSAAIAAAVIVWLLSGQFGGDDTEAVAGNDAAAVAERRSSVRVRTQVAETVQRMIAINGKTAPARIVQLAAETDGRVTSIGAERGSDVARGKMIVRLDERDRRARLAQAEATVRQREVEYDGRMKLKSESYVSEAQLQEAVALLETARAELTRARLDLDYMLIKAPFDGALQARHVEIGDYVSRGDPVATFVDNRKIVVTANLSEFDAGHVRVDDKADAELATGERVSGRIRYVAPVADESTRTFAVELEIDNANGELRAGGTARLMIPAEDVLAHRVSPSLMTLDDSGQLGLKIVDENNAVRFVAADIALARGDDVWLTGLPDSVDIITVGQGFVAAGAIVEPVQESAIGSPPTMRAGSDE